MLRAVLFLFFFATPALATPALATEKVIEVRECSHPAIIKRLNETIKTGEPISLAGDWNRCVVVKNVVGTKKINDYQINGNSKHVFRLLFRENADGKFSLFIQEIIFLPDGGEAV